jgi:hypothetical protein
VGCGDGGRGVLPPPGPSSSLHHPPGQAVTTGQDKETQIFPNDPLLFLFDKEVRGRVMVDGKMPGLVQWRLLVGALVVVPW